MPCHKDDSSIEVQSANSSSPPMRNKSYSPKFLCRQSQASMISLSPQTWPFWSFVCFSPVITDVKSKCHAIASSVFRYQSVPAQYLPFQCGMVPAPFNEITLLQLMIVTHGDFLKTFNQLKSFFTAKTAEGFRRKTDSAAVIAAIL